MLLFEFGDFQSLPADIDIAAFKAYLKRVWEKRYLFYEIEESNIEESNKEQETDEKQNTLLSRQGLLNFDGQEVQARNYAGIIHFNGYTFYLLPKLFKRANFTTETIFEHLQFYLSYCKNIRLPWIGQQLVSFSGENSFQSLIHSFAVFTEKILAERPYRIYQEVEEPTPFLRGSLQVPEYLRNHITTGQWQMLPSRYSPFTYDNTFNRAVKYTAHLLLSHAAKETLPFLHSMLFLLQEVQEEHFSFAHCKEIDTNALEEEQRLVLEFCKLFLLNREIVGEEFNRASHFSLLLPMERVFEDFIAGFVASHFPEVEKEIQSTTYLATIHNQKAVQVRNDIWLPQKRVIIDTKYKLLSDLGSSGKNVQASDLYQMLAYAISRKAGQVYLLYPGIIIEEKEPTTVMINEGLGEESVFIHIHQIPMIAPAGEPIAEYLNPIIRRRLEKILEI